ncbi:MAG: hypothetical protein ACOZCL_11420 [Bacillota bacterium]
MKRKRVPKPPFIVNVGIVGHRALNDIDELLFEQRIQEVMLNLEKILKSIHNNAIYMYDMSTKPKLRMISSLAAGTYTVIPEAAYEMNFSDIQLDLQCPIPYDIEAYKNDLSPENKEIFCRLIEKASSIMQLSGSYQKIANENIKYIKNRSDSYHFSNMITVYHSDIIIAVWDENKKPEYKGGIGYVVREAKKRGIPVICIHPDSKQQHKISIIDNDRDWVQALSEKMNKHMVPNYMTGVHDKTAPYEYFLEKQKPFCLAFLYDWFFNLLIGKKSSIKDIVTVSDFGEAGATNCSKILESSNTCRDLATLMQQISGVAAGYYGWADGLASYYSKMYHTALILRAALVVFVLISAVIGSYSPDISWNIAGFTLQGTFLLIIITLTYLSRRQKWLSKYVDYRLIAEMLRNYLFAAPIGLGLPKLKMSVYNRNEYTLWIRCYIRAISRIMGLPNCKVNNSFLKGYYDLLRNQGIKSQYDFMTQNSAKYKIISKKISKLGVILFLCGITMVPMKAFILWMSIKHSIPDFAASISVMLLDILNILLSGTGTTLFAINSLCEFDKLSIRFGNMSYKLNCILIEENPHCEDFIGIAREAEEFIELMLGEVNDWRILLRSKVLSYI